MEVEYICLREEFLSIAQFHISTDALNIIKSHYAQLINSNRKLSQIKNLRTLLKVLEKRDTLGFSNIDPIIYISNNFLCDFVMQQKIENYNSHLKNIQHIPSCHTYKDSNENTGADETQPTATEDNIEPINVLNQWVTSQRTNQHKNPLTLHVPVDHKTSFSEQELALQQTLLSRISERIGRSWRDMARYLGLPECQIDAIQNKHVFDLKEQSYEALQLYISQYSTDSWQLNLLHALEKARRRDLKELVEKLIVELSKHV